jgi:hypothetical protein
LIKNFVKVVRSSGSKLSLKQSCERDDAVKQRKLLVCVLRISREKCCLVLRFFWVIFELVHLMMNSRWSKFGLWYNYLWLTKSVRNHYVILDQLMSVFISTR